MNEYAKKIEEAITWLNEDGDLFCDMVDELDSWNGFADGYRCWQMAELDELCYGMKLTEFLDNVSDDFNLKDDYVYFTVYGIESTNDRLDLYRCNTSSEEVLDNVLECANHLYFYDKEFEQFINYILELKEELNA